MEQNEKDAMINKLVILIMEEIDWLNELLQNAIDGNLGNVHPDFIKTLQKNRDEKEQFIFDHFGFDSEYIIKK